MDWRKISIAVFLATALAGCISTPSTKALITPIGAAGIYSFAPQRSPDEMKSAVDTSERLANLQRTSAQQDEENRSR